MAEKTAVSAVCWIPKGLLKEKPDHYNMSEQELKELEAEAAELSENEEMDPQGDGAVDGDDDMANYDKEGVDGMNLFSVLDKDLELNDDAKSDSDNSDAEYHNIRDTDLLFAAACIEEDVCSIEVYLYEEEDANMYVHHDILLPAYPLCLEVLPTAEGKKGAWLAVGSFNPTIDIWDLNMLDAVNPVCQLGLKKKQKGKKVTAAASHSEPVLALSRNFGRENILASGSADSTVKLWDVDTLACAHSYDKLHSDKVQCVAWHPAEHSVLMTASFDKTCAILDSRMPDKAVKTKLTADAESAQWSMKNPMQALVTCEDGSIHCLDVRNIANGKAESVYTIMAHDGACTAAKDSANGMMVTSALDGVAKVWDVTGATPNCVFTKNMQAGPLFGCNICPSMPNLVNFAAQCAVVWDLK